MATFAHSLNQFKTIAGKPSDSDLAQIWEEIAPLLLQIQKNDETGAVHNLIGLIYPEAANIAHYSAAFPETARVGAYDPSIDNDATAVVRAQRSGA